VAKRVFGEIYEGEYGKNKRFCIELDATYKDSGDPVINRYNYQKWDDEAGAWKEPSKNSGYAHLLAALKVCKVEGQSKPGVKMPNGIKDLQGEKFDWVRKEIELKGLDNNMVVTVPVKWYPATQ